MATRHPTIEDQLAKEMARLKIEDSRKTKEVERICAQSEELKQLQAKIMAAYQNKERAAQITEKQYRQQVQVVSSPSLNVGTRHPDRQDHAPDQRDPRRDTERGRARQTQRPPQQQANHPSLN